MSIRGSRGKPLSGSSGEPRYARIPTSVLRDLELRPFDKIVYAEMALWVFEGTTCTIGHRVIAERLGLARNTVASSIQRLCERGHVKLNRPNGKGRRPIYVLTSPVFGKKQGQETIVASAPSGGRRLVSVAKEEVA